MLVQPDSAAPLISIIIVTFKAQEYLPRTLASLAQQAEIDSREVEVLVIDGGSTDDTMNIVSSYQFIGKAVSEPDNGIYDAMNKGARLASGRWLHFLNAGDSFTGPEGLGTAMHLLRTADDRQVPWAIAAAQNLAGGGGLVRRIPSVPHVWWRHAYGLQPHCHQATWFKTATFVDSGAHALKFKTADDFDVILRFGMLAAPLATDRVLIDYLGGGISEVTAALTPALQHQVRVERFQLGPIGRRLDRQVGLAIHAFNRLRITIGKFRRPRR